MLQVRIVGGRPYVINTGTEPVTINVGSELPAFFLEEEKRSKLPNVTGYHCHNCGSSNTEEELADHNCCVSCGQKLFG